MMTKICRSTPANMKNIKEMKPENILEAYEILLYRSNKTPKEIRGFVNGLPGQHMDASKMSRIVSGERSFDLALVYAIEDFTCEHPVSEFREKQRCMKRGTES